MSYYCSLKIKSLKQQKQQNSSQNNSEGVSVQSDLMCRKVIQLVVCTSKQNS